MTSDRPETPDADVYQVVRRLNAHVGTSCRRGAGGSRDSTSPHGWAEGVAPDRTAEGRIRAAYRA